MKARDAEHTAETQEQIERFRRLGWYHSIELPNGEVIQGHQSLEHQRLRLLQFPIPDDLPAGAGARVRVEPGPGVRGVAGDA